MRSKRIAIAAGIVATLALFGGTVASAAPVSPNGTGAVRQAAATPNSVDSSSVVDNSLSHLDVKNGTLGQSDMFPGANSAYLSTYDNTVRSISVVNGSLGQVDLDAATNAKINANAILTVTADTMVTNRPDTATDASVWAKDNMTRTLTVVRQHATKASNCGSGAVKCWLYTGTIKDNGTFTTIAGAHGPNSATPINGIVNGTVNGVYEIEFYANSDVPNSTHVDSTIDGSSPSTSDWMKLAFPAGTQFSGFTGVDYKWVYNAPATCEVHTQSTASNTGDILGVNGC